MLLWKAQLYHSVSPCSALQVENYHTIKPGGIYWFTSLTWTTVTEAGFDELQCFCLHSQALSFELLKIFRAVFPAVSPAEFACANSHGRVNWRSPGVSSSQQVTLSTADVYFCGALMQVFKNMEIYQTCQHDVGSQILLRSLKPFRCYWKLVYIYSRKHRSSWKAPASTNPISLLLLSETQQFWAVLIKTLLYLRWSTGKKLRATTKTGWKLNVEDVICQEYRVG